MRKTLGHLLEELKELQYEQEQIISKIEDILDNDDDLYLDEEDII
jgi:hypothetical protein